MPDQRAATPSIWAVLPAAGKGTRFGGGIPKQYLELAGKPVIRHALEAVLAHPRVTGAVVALAADDTFWPGWQELASKPVLRCTGGAERADSVLEALRAIPDAADDALVLVHDAARPNLDPADLARLIEAAETCAGGAILAAPVRDTLKRDHGDGSIAATQSRERLWRAFTPQAFRHGPMVRALERARADGVRVTDEAMAMERTGARPRLVEGREDNLKVTTPADLALAEFLVSRSNR